MTTPETIIASIATNLLIEFTKRLPALIRAATLSEGDTSLDDLMPVGAAELRAREDLRAEEAASRT